MVGKSRSKKDGPVVEVLTEEHKQAEQAARELHKAMEGLGTNEKEIIRIVLGNTNQQLQLIKNQYLILYKQVCFYSRLATA